MIWLALASAWAAEVTVPVIHQPPANLPLFAAARIVDVKGVAKGDDCPGAVTAAIAEAREEGLVLRVVLSADELTPPTETRCKKRMQGDDVGSSVVQLTAVVALPGTGATITTDRAVQMVSILGSFGDLEGTSIFTVDGASFLNLGSEAIKGELDSSRFDVNARAFGAYNTFVVDWIRRWSGVIAALPELRGAVIEVAVSSNNPDKKKSKVREIFRFVVPADAAKAYMSGGKTDEELISAMRVQRAPEAKKPAFEPFAMDLSEGIIGLDAGFEAEERDLDVDPMDLVGVEDEENPK